MPFVRCGLVKHLLFFLLLTLGTQAQGQWLKIGYRAESLSRPGLALAIENPIRTDSKSWQPFVGFGLNYYLHRHNHQAVLFGPQLGLRYTHPRGIFGDLRIDLNVYRSFYAGTTYEATSDGLFRKIPLAGQWGFAPGIQLAGGYDFRQHYQKPYRISTGLSYYQQWPYSSSYRHGYALDLTLHYLLQP